MATNVYKVGTTLCVLPDGDTIPKTWGYWTAGTNGVNVYIKNILEPGSPDYAIPVADVRTKAGAAIGGQTANEVLEYCLDPTT